MPFKLSYAGNNSIRVDKFICQCLQEIAEWNDVTRSQVKLWITAGCVAVNGVTVHKSGAIVQPGDTVEVDPLDSDYELASFRLELEILHEDDSLLVINKPAGLSMHPGAGNKSATLVNALLAYFRENSTVPKVFLEKSAIQPTRPGVVHRLDKDTTGIVVVAKTLRAHHALAKQFEEHSVKRAYMALVFSTLRARREIGQKESGTISAPLGRHASQRTRIAVRQQGGKHAVTHWRVIERMPYGCLVEARLETGRTHQIRVHMSHIGSPVIGDKTYGDFSGLPAALKRAQEKFGRQALHAYALEFEHPLSGERLSFKTACPDEMQKLLAVFRSYRQP